MAHVVITKSDIDGAVAELTKLASSLTAGQRAALAAMLRGSRLTAAQPLTYEPQPPDIRNDPYQHYAELRVDNPVHWSAAAGAWVLSRYDHVAAALRDPRLGVQPRSSGAGDECTLAGVLGPAISQVDPPQHTAERRAFNRIVGADAAPRLRAVVEESAPRLSAAFPVDATVDLVSGFAVPLATETAFSLVRIPHRERTVLVPLVRDVLAVYRDGIGDTPAMRRGRRAAGRLLAYFRERGDNASLCLQALIGAYAVEPAISMGLYTLLRVPGAWQEVCAEPERAEALVDELLRFDGPAQTVSRVALTDLEFAGRQVRRGECVLLILGAANRDPERFACPEQVRNDRRPAAHLAFGAGVHACPGVPIARTVVGVAIATLAHMHPGLRLETDGQTWEPDPSARWLRSLRATVSRAE